MVQIDVGVSCGVDKLTRLQVANLGYHHGEKSVGCDVKRNPEESVRASLIKLAGEFPFGNVELEEAVAGWQGHLVNLSRIPCRDKDSSRVRVTLDCVDHLAELVDSPSVRRRPGTPLVAIDRTQIAVLVCPLIPNRHSMVFEILDVSVSSNKP